MLLTCAIDLIVVVVLLWLASQKGVDGALPFAAFVIALVPLESEIIIPGLFDILTQRVAIVTLAVLYVFLWRGNDETKPASTPMKYLIAAAILWLGISSINSLEPGSSFKASLCEVLDLYLLYYIFVKTVSRVETVNRILMAIVAAMVVCCGFALIESYWQWSVTSLFPFIASASGLTLDQARGLRVHSTYPVCQLFGAALAMALPLTLYLITIARTTLQRDFLWLGVILFPWLDFKTGSRGPWIAMAVSLIPLFFYRPARKHLGIVMFLVVAVLVLRPGVYHSIVDMYTATVNPNSELNGDYEGRYELVGDAWGAICKSPDRMLWGYGEGTWRDMGFVSVYANGSVHPVLSVDSDVAGFLQELGIVGALIIFALLVKPAVGAFRNSRGAQGAESLLCLALCGSILAFVFMTTNVAVYGWGQQGFWVFIIISLAMTYPKWAGSEASLAEEKVNHSSIPAPAWGLQPQVHAWRNIRERVRR
jgi:O-antigen ligase